MLYAILRTLLIQYVFIRERSIQYCKRMMMLPEACPEAICYFAEVLSSANRLKVAAY
jgi:hypothetical protein